MVMLSWILASTYLAIPPLALLLAIWRVRRNMAIGRPNAAQPLFALMVTLSSSIILGSTIVLVYAYASDARAPIGQLALTSYVFIGVLSLLKSFNWLLREGAERLFLLAGRWRRPGPGFRLRATGASACRALVLFGVGLPFVMAIGMVYRPKVIGADEPSHYGYRYEHVNFPATDGVRLDAWWIPAASAGKSGTPAPANWGTRTVLLCHGLGSSKSNGLIMARDLPNRGFNVLAFDFRAHGASGGQISGFGDLERQDVLGAVRWARAAHPRECRKLYGLGISMGGAALIAAAADPTSEGRAIDAIAVYDTYDDLGNLAQDLTHKFFLPPLAWLATHLALPLASAHAGVDLADFRPVDLVDRIAPRPLLVVHGRGDDIIDVEHGEKLFQAASEPKLSCWIGKLKPVKKDDPHLIWIDSDEFPADHNGVMLSNEASRAMQLFFSSAKTAL